MSAPHKAVGDCHHGRRPAPDCRISLGLLASRQSVFSPAEHRVESASPSRGGGEVNMSIRFSCAQCGKAFAVGEQFAGKRVKCNGCGVLMTVPAATAALAATGVTPPPLPGDACPACHGSLPQGAVLCTACGFDLRTGRRLTTRTEPPPPYLMGTDPSRVVWGVLGALALVAALAVGIGVV